MDTNYGKKDAGREGVGYKEHGMVLKVDITEL